MKYNSFVVSVVLILLVGCVETPNQPPMYYEGDDTSLVPIFSIECLQDKRTVGNNVPIYEYGSTLMVRAVNIHDGTHCFAGVSLDEKKVKWYLPNPHPDHSWINQGYLHDNLFVVMSKNSDVNKGDTALYCFDLDTQTIVWSKDSWQSLAMWRGVVGYNDYCYHFEVPQDEDCVRLIKTHILTGESTILYENTTGSVFPNGGLKLASIGGTLYLIFCMWDLEKDSSRESTMILNVYDVTNNKLTYQNHLPAVEQVGVVVTEPKGEVIYINQGRTMYCFDFVKGEIVWSNNLDYEITHQVVVLDNGNILRLAQGELSYVNGTSGDVIWESRYHKDLDLLPMWVAVHDNYAYIHMSVYQIDVRDLNRNGKLAGVVRYEKAQFEASIPAYMDSDGFLVLTQKEILKYPYLD